MKKRVKTPKEIVSKMEQWREGLVSFPREYIDFHRELAEEELSNMKQMGMTIFEDTKKLDSDGWEDGMKVIKVDVVDLNGVKHELHWNDGSQAFFMKGKHGGSYSFDYRDNYKRYVIYQMESGSPKKFFSLEEEQEDVSLSEYGYKMVYDDSIRVNNEETDYHLLNRLYEKFNIDQPFDFRGHSLSISDLVVINGKGYYCQSFGWKEVNVKKLKKVFQK